MARATTSATRKAPAKTRARKPARPQAVPMLDLSRQFRLVGKAVTAAVTKVCASQQYILGPEVQAFEKEAAAYLEVEHAVGCASGTDALWLALVAAGIEPGDEVLTTPFTFFATASAITRAGARPVFVDVDDSTLNLDAEKTERRITETSSARLKGLLPVHLFGQCADMDGLNEVAARHRLAVVEDAAQAFGASWRGKRAGGLGRLAAFSFYPTKNLSCYGDGGLVTSNDPTLAEHVRRLRNHGSSRRYYHEEIGWNSRLDSVQAAVLRVKLPYIEEWNHERGRRATAYDMLLKAAGLLSSRGAKKAAPVRLLGRTRHASHVYHQYVVRVERREELRAFLAERKIGSEVYYPAPLHLQKCFAYLGYTEGDLPVSEAAAKQVLALPLFPELTPEEQATVVNALADFYS